jgi:hypothetical protein
MKAGISDPETTPIASQRHGKHDSAVTNDHATEELLEAVFSMRSVPRSYNENQRVFLVSRECELVAVWSRRSVAAGSGVSNGSGGVSIVEAVTKQRLVKTITG